MCLTARAKIVKHRIGKIFDWRTTIDRLVSIEPRKSQIVNRKFAHITIPPSTGNTWPVT